MGSEIPGPLPCKQVSRVQQVEMEQGGQLQGSTQTTALSAASPQLPIFFSPERAERHDAQEILRIARDLVHKVQMLIENK